MSTMPADQAARDAIAEVLDRTLFVEAGAGTGKTTALIERVAALVESGRATIEQIAAITFTEAAAAELRDRVLVRFERDEQDETLLPEQRERARRARIELDDAAIETIHGFASRLLSLHPLEAGLPPGFAVRDQVESDIAFDDRWREHLDAMLEDPALAEPLLRAIALGVGVDHLREVAAGMHADWDRVAAWLEGSRPAPAEHPDIADIVAGVGDHLRELCALRSQCTDETDPMAVHLAALEERCDRLERLAARDPLEALRLLALDGGIRSRGGRQPNWSNAPMTAAEMREALREVDEMRAALVQDVIDAVIADLGASLGRFAVAYAEERRQAGAIEFHDMLVRARDLLRDEPAVRAALRERFPFLLIDEFQDTDPLQTEIAFLLAAPADADAVSSWRDVTPEAGRLFFVGDPKQSIYRFRRADIELYHEVQGRCSGELQRLTENFRSLPGVIEYVNALFGELMPPAPALGQPAYVELRAARERREGPAVRLLGEPLPEAKADDVRQQEAAEIARAIRAAKAREWPVYERIDGEERARPARYSDVAILVPRRTGLDVLREALEAAAIPYRLVSRSLIYDTPEVRDLLIVLRAIDDPTDQVALVAALRSPAFACGDDDLFTFVDAGGRWDYRRDLPEALDAAHPVAEGMRWLRALHEERWWMPVSALVERVIRERRLLELAFVDRRPRERWQRLRFLADQARAFEDGGGTGLRRFLEWTDRQAADQAMVNESVVPEQDDDAVRVMTIHASKGLQFPIVAVTGFDGDRRRFPPSLYWAEDGSPRVRLCSGIEQTGYGDLNDAAKALDDLEEARLLYVALTRACDHLLVGAHHVPKKNGESLAAAMHRVAVGHPALCVPVEPGDDAPDEPAPPPPELITGADRAAWIAEREQAVAALSRIPARSATALAKEAMARAGGGADGDPNLAKEEPREEEPPWKRGRGGTEFGRAVHSVLQVIDLESGADLDAFAAAQAVAEGIPERRAEVAAAARRALASDAVREAVAGGRYWREVYVGAPVEGVLVEGFIDLLYETPEGYVVVDFKTDALPGAAEIDSAAARYRPQLAAYALALAEHLDRPVSHATLLFLGAGGAAERPVGELARAMAELREALPTL